MPCFLSAILKLPRCVQVYWRHAAGDLDRYVVLIRYNHTVLQNKSVSAGHNECAFSSLTPGRLYSVAVETWSGGAVSRASTFGRTRESESKETSATRSRPFSNGWIVFQFLQLLAICR